MARNKYPEQTVEHILSVSAKLFIEKGFDKTSIQDIIQELGMSKGAVYHHFKSKDEILGAVMRRHFDRAAQMLDELVAYTQAANAREKLVRILEHSIADPEAHAMDRILSAQIKNPQFVVAGIQGGVNKDAAIIAQIMMEGREDGSIHTDYPVECAEVFMMLVNIWANPILFERTLPETSRRLTFLQHMMKQLGVDIVSDALIQQIIDRHTEMGGYQ
ncbi:TetR family transcriptional regulator [Paenibacillus selenitireducens]|uniref:TetR family transcriptional regulator n=1 Tax=Paenibacillus selenitireducens TaxID=1324314 RepID=A0A1T2XHD4_9BACL|nr:TetR/AcrR family transcriptional regulator [Paenibacillus selenitireducens]OPA79218.1 TetR family transcriptional regulator [Paenibacillus selenitireducens]